MIRRVNGDWKYRGKVGLRCESAAVVKKKIKDITLTQFRTHEIIRTE